ncbi:hypothetical protein JI435_420240 [Parastagonospora nodorum SN15]|uniref:Uncharacterized protein n=1 Tax=Phaeosphaeria nodorum (strain SN15 / ATCC MYA-4574 / FGSC 10173) TaxID=321614 RepID=A0A7U2I6N1_PHANO|nr:hypothetical protein JI435_420240 [Parastagonospora nodorum SN15]
MTRRCCSPRRKGIGCDERVFGKGTVEKERGDRWLYGIIMHGQN